MNRVKIKRLLSTALVTAGIAALAACTQTPAPPPAPPPVVKAMSRPYPPMGAAPNLPIPPLGADGTRLTINSNLSSKQAAWNLRSAYNVAALNCHSSRHASMIDDYGAFLKANEKTLRGVNASLDGTFKERYGKKYIAEREGFQTQVYNYFALPPTMLAFCDATAAVGAELKTLPSGQLETYAPTGLAKLETVFLDFFDRYDRYRRDFVQWQVDFINKYGQPPSDGYYLPGEPRYRPAPVDTSGSSVSTTVAELR